MYVSGLYTSTTDFDAGTGIDSRTNAGGFDAFLVSYDSNGNYRWAWNAGGTGSDISFGITSDTNGNVFVSGQFASATPIDFNPDPAGVDEKTSAGSGDMFLTSLSSAGVYNWTFTLGSTGSDVMNGITIGADGNIYATGNFASSSIDLDPTAGTDIKTNGGSSVHDVFLASYTTSGGYLWGRSFGGTSNDYGTNVKVSPSGNEIYVTGYSTSGTIDFDPGTGTDTRTGAGGADGFLVSFDSTGAYRWVQTIGGTGDDRVNIVSVSPTGNVIAGGFFNATMDSDPGAGINNLVSAGGNDMFFVRYASNGSYQNAWSIGGTGADSVVGLAYVSDTLLYASGSYGATVDFNPGPGTDSKTSSATTNSFVTSYNEAAPTITLTALTPDPNNDSTPALTGSVTDVGSALVSVEYQIDSTAGTWNACTPNDGTFDGATEAFTCTVSAALSNGSHTMYVRATDSNSKTTPPGSESSDTFSIDTTAPSLSVTAPTTGSTVNGSQVVTFTNSEPTAPQCSVNNTDWVSCTSGSTTLSQMTGWSALPEGFSFTLYLRDTDPSGNTGTAQVANLTKAVTDTTPPVRSNPAPSGSLTAGTTSTTMTLTTNETATCKYGTTDQAYASLPNTFTTTNSTSHSQTISGLSNGQSYTYHIRCQDTAGNANTTDFTVSFSVANPADTTAPVLTLTALSPDPNTDNTPALTGSATDAGSTISSVQYQMDSTAGTWNACTPNDGTFNAGTEAFTCTVSAALTDGSHTMYVRATDSSGNVVTNANAATDTFTIDATVPTRSNPAPSGSLTAGTTSTTMTLTTNETATCKYGTTDQAYASLPNTFTTTNSTSHSQTISGLSNGQSYTYHIRCQDTAGNANTTDFTVSFSVANPADTTAPVLTISAPASGATVSSSDTVTFTNSEPTAPQCSVNNTDWVSCTSGSTTLSQMTGWGSIAEGATFTLYLRDTDPSGNTGTAQRSFSKAVTAGAAPVRSNLLPSGTLAAGTTQATLSLSTNMNATCKYGTTSQAYASLPNTFTTTGTTSHSQVVTGLMNGQSYTYYVRCTDTGGNVNTTDSFISFAIATPGQTPAPAPAVSPTKSNDDDDEDESRNLNVHHVKSNATKDTITITWDTDYPTTGVVRYGTTKMLLEKREENQKDKDHRVILTGLKPNTLYYFRVKAKDGNDNTDSSRIHFVKTLAAPSMKTLPSEKTSSPTKPASSLTSSPSVSQTLPSKTDMSSTADREAEERLRRAAESVSTPPNESKQEMEKAPERMTETETTPPVPVSSETAPIEEAAPWWNPFKSFTSFTLLILLPVSVLSLFFFWWKQRGV
ncbi:MAG: fibronectin type III domain-containing protein [Candidatus Moraniibacteriota bacterium]|nr:MAG: fibronectin type III domain-containing protein [Candidatus Moranbacteria bacterium]